MSRSFHPGDFSMLVPLSAEAVTFGHRYVLEAGQDEQLALAERLITESTALAAQLGIEDYMITGLGLDYSPILGVKLATIVATLRQHDLLSRRLPEITYSVGNRMTSELDRLGDAWTAAMLARYRSVQKDFVRYLPQLTKGQTKEELTFSALYMLRTFDLAAAA